MQRIDTSPTYARAKRGEIVADAPPLDKWPKPNIADLPEHQMTLFLKTKLAVKMWLDGDSEKTIKQETEFTAASVRRLVGRCMRIDPYTREIAGFNACLPNHQIRLPPRQRHREFQPSLVEQGKGLTGALGSLFATYPVIEKKLTAFVLKRTESDAAPVSIITIAGVYDRFIALCKETGLHERNEWPFSVERKGYEAVRRWYKKLRHSNPARTILNEFGDDAAKNNVIDSTTSNNPRPRAVYLANERWELDGHKKDALWSVMTPVGGDRFVHAATNRLWALLMVDVGSNVVLSSGMSTALNYSRADVLRLCYRAIYPPVRNNLLISNQHFRYDEGACYPGEMPEFTGLVCQTLAFDGAASHFSEQMRLMLEYEFGCHVDGERIGTPTARHVIEGFFVSLASMAQLLTSSTGNRPDSPARRGPESAAEKWCVVGPLCADLLDVRSRNHNVTPSAQCGGISPLHLLQEMTAKGQIYRSPVGELNRQNLYRFLPRYRATVGRKRGATSLSPLGVNLYGGRYVGPALARDAELSYCGNYNVWVYVQEDARYAFVVSDAFPERCYPVSLTGAYSDAAHTLEWRAKTAAFRKKMGIKGKVDTANLLTGFLRALGDAAKTNNAAASLLSGTVAFMENHGRDQIAYIGMEPSARKELTAFAAKVAEECAREGLSQDDDEDLDSAAVIVIGSGDYESPTNLEGTKPFAGSSLDATRGLARGASFKTFGLL